MISKWLRGSTEIEIIGVDLYPTQIFSDASSRESLCC